MRLPRLLQERPTAKGDGRDANVMAVMAKTALISLDDWGLAQCDDASRHDVLALLEDRHGRHSTLVTSQLPVAHWHEAIGDPTLADAMLDRLIHHAYKLSLTGDALRKSLSTTTSTEPKAEDHPSG